MKILFYIIFSFSAWAEDIPYEKCTWRNKKFTDRLVNEAKNFQTESDCPSATCYTQDKDLVHSNLTDYQTTIDPTEKALSIPPECFFMSAVRSVEKKPDYIKDDEGKNTSATNYYYCDSMEDKKAKRYAPTLTNTGEKKNLYPRPPCLNEDYIMMTYNSFHDMANCFGFSQDDKKSLFQLFNHESHFILNNKSDTGARCYGQLTLESLMEINKRIYVSDVSSREESQIYKEALKNCPDLSSQLLIPDRMQPGATQGPWWIVKNRSGRQKYKSKFDAFDDDHNHVLSAGETMDCAITQNADTCFFYAMYNARINQLRLTKTMNRDSSGFPRHVDTRSETAKSKQLRQVIQDFQLPLKLNEMLIVRGYITKEGTRVKKNWLMKSDREIYDTLYDEDGNRTLEYSIEDLEIKKIPVFDMNEQTQRDLLYQAYNGGIAVVNEELIGFIKKEKHYMSLGIHCKNNPEELACQNREILMNKGEKLPFDVERFAENQNLSVQTSKFPAQIVRDQDYLNDQSHQPSNPTPLTNHLYRLKGIKPKDSRRHNSTTLEEEKKNIDNFVGSMKGKCQF